MVISFSSPIPVQTGSAFFVRIFQSSLCCHSSPLNPFSRRSLSTQFDPSKICKSYSNSCHHLHIESQYRVCYFLLHCIQFKLCHNIVIRRADGELRKTVISLITQPCLSTFIFCATTKSFGFFLRNSPSPIRSV